MVENRPSDPVERLRRAAIHEAGHSVMFIHYEIAFEKIWIAPDDDVPGEVVVPWPLPSANPEAWWSTSQKDEIRRYLACFTAGSVSEALTFSVLPESPHSISLTDVIQMKEILEPLDLSDVEFEDEVRSAVTQANQILILPQVWAQVVALSERLMVARELTEPEAKYICSEAQIAQYSSM